MVSEDLGSSSKAYSPVILDTFLKQRDPFTPGFYEWLSIRGETIIEDAVRTSAGSTTIYSVPNGYDLFITSIQITRTSNSAGAGTDECLITANGQVLISLQINQNLTDSISNSYSIPLYFPSGVTFALQQDDAGRSRGVIAGFLIKKDQIPQI